MGSIIFLDLKNRIADELKPDFLLIDSRTGITEMGGVAMTLLADKVISFVLPTSENLEGARAVLRSLRRSRRENGASDVAIRVALSRLPQTKESEDERDWTERICTTLNEEADDLRDTLSCTEVFVLHSEVELELRESLRVGSGISPDDSILLRDYLRLFAHIVPQEWIEPKFGKLIQHAKDKMWDDPEAALKEMEELAESFGHPDNYRELLRFYEVRNVGGTPALKRAQRLWDLTRNSNDGTLWQTLLRAFEPKQRWRAEKEWSPNLDFVEAVWRAAGKKNPGFALKIAEAHSQEDHESRAADVLLEVIRTFEPTSDLASRCISFLDISDRVAEADKLIQELKPKLSGDPKFFEAWARHALRDLNKDALAELVQPPTRDLIGTMRPSIAAQVFFRSGLMEEAGSLADRVLREMRERPPGSERDIRGIAELFRELGRWEDFEKSLEGRYPPNILEEMLGRPETRRRHVGRFVSRG